MNDQKIYELMFKTPGIRAVQIADALDAELVDVSEALKALVEIGDVVQSKGFSPNGRQAMIYNLSETFKRSRQYSNLVADAAAHAKAAVNLVAMAGGRDFINTEEFARVMNLATATIYKNHSLHGEVCGIRPRKVGKFLMWPMAAVAQVFGYADGEFRCDVRPGDVIELQRGGVSIGTLERDEAISLRDFLNRVLPRGEG
jgi:predicted transcriptional regulator